MKQKITILLFVLSFTLSYGQTIVGQWDFDDSCDLGKATIGTDLTLFGTVTSSTGPEAGNGVALLENGDYLDATVAIAPSGAGSLVNTYTLLEHGQV